MIEDRSTESSPELQHALQLLLEWSSTLSPELRRILLICLLSVVLVACGNSSPTSSVPHESTPIAVQAPESTAIRGILAPTAEAVQARGVYEPFEAIPYERLAELGISREVFTTLAQSIVRIAAEDSANPEAGVHAGTAWVVDKWEDSATNEQVFVLATALHTFGEVGREYPELSTVQLHSPLQPELRHIVRVDHVHYLREAGSEVLSDVVLLYLRIPNAELSTFIDLQPVSVIEGGGFTRTRFDGTLGMVIGYPGDFSTAFGGGAALAITEGAITTLTHPDLNNGRPTFVIFGAEGKGGMSGGIVVAVENGRLIPIGGIKQSIELSDNQGNRHDVTAFEVLDGAIIEQAKLQYQSSSSSTD